MCSICKNNFNIYSETWLWNVNKSTCFPLVPKQRRFTYTMKQCRTKVWKMWIAVKKNKIWEGFCWIFSNTCHYNYMKVKRLNLYNEMLKIKKYYRSLWWSFPTNASPGWLCGRFMTGKHLRRNVIYCTPLFHGDLAVLRISQLTEYCLALDTPPEIELVDNFKLRVQ